MSTTSPAMSVEDIFRDSSALDPSATYPTKSLQQQANTLVTQIYGKYEQLCNIVSPSFEDLVARWQGMTRSERVKMLIQACPELSRVHQPEDFDKGHVRSAELRGAVPPEVYMLPFVNLNDLQDKNRLLMLIDARARQPPHAYASTELKFVPHGQVERPDSNGNFARSPLLKMQLEGPQKYGKITFVRSKQEASDFECEAKGLSPIAGLQVLYIQNKLFDFLLGIVKNLLQGKQRDVAYGHSPVAREPYSGDEENGTLSFLEMVTSEPYRPQLGPQLGLLLRQVAVGARRAHDRVWDIREDPRHFEALYNTTTDHDVAHVRDIRGIIDPNLGGPQFVRTLLTDMVTRSHYRLI